MNNSIKLFQASLFHHLDIEVGAPTLYNYAPFGGKEKNFIYRVAEILHLPKPVDSNEIATIASHYAEYCINLPKLIENFVIPLGTYEVPDIQTSIQELINNWSELEVNMKIDSAVENGFQSKQYLCQIDITPLHLTLLKKLEWRIEHNYNFFAHLNETNTKKNMVSKMVEIHNYALKPENSNLRFNIPVPTANPKYPYGDYLHDEYTPKIQKELALVMQALAIFGRIG